MRIFLSYDDTRRDVAARLALGLRAAGHRVFFDQDSLPAGTSYDDRIRNAIQRSHLFVFLISRESVSRGAYALTELAIAERRWTHPTGRVLPVLLDDTPIPSLPPYLRAVSVLVPKGDVVADALHAVAVLADERRRVIMRRSAAMAAGVLGVVALILFFGRPGDGSTGENGAPSDSLVVDASRGDSAIASERVTPVPAESATDIMDDPDNPHTWKLKNDRHVRLVGEIVANESNVADNIVREAIEWSAWRYNRCYDGSFGHLTGDLPEGEVVVAFDIEDQLPRRATVQRSDFDVADFDECVVGTVTGQTVNAAGPTGAGRVVYAFRFLPN